MENKQPAGILPRFCIAVLFSASVGLVTPLCILAVYKVVLKDGKVIEAKSKPVSMEGNFRFTDNQGQFHTIPVALIDLNVTEASNRSEAQAPKATKILTNEDLAKGGSNPSQTEGHQSQSIPANEKSIPKAEPSRSKKGEAHWRGQAKKIRDQIAIVDNEIKSLNEKIKSGKSDGIKYGLDTYNQYIVAGFGDQMKPLEKEKERLQKMMSALEEEARKAGALPGWLR